MNIDIKVEGLDELVSFFSKISNVLDSNSFKTYLGEKALNVINKYSESNLVEKSTDYVNHNKMKLLKDGVLIYNDIANPSGDHFSLILEYGSGTHAEKPHIGNTPVFVESHKVYWFIPAEKAPNLVQKETVEGESLYIMFGQEPKHIYTDAAREIEENISDWAADYINKNLHK